jgi:hypothetical protein
LDAIQDTDGSSFLFDQGTTEEEHRTFLMPTPGEGWLADVSRFGCSSDVGRWCIYVERRAEIAVIAFRDRGAVREYSSRS